MGSAFATLLLFLSSFLCLSYCFLGSEEREREREGERFAEKGGGGSGEALAATDRKGVGFPTLFVVIIIMLRKLPPCAKYFPKGGGDVDDMRLIFDCCSRHSF